ncbi:MAG: NAD(P)/FAD-dependent oxidoreductase [Trueperaceae bacterium]
MQEQLDVIVIGGGQAGLALGYYLKQLGVRFSILDGADEIGAAWRSRWDSLTLFTPSQWARLPGLPFPKPSDSYPSKDEVADYLKRYAEQFELPVDLNSRVVGLKRRDHTFLVQTETAELEATQVVVATGPFQRPLVPALGLELDEEVVQLHSSGYRNPHSLPPGEVLVVGAGNSGMQIAEEIAASRKVILSQGRTLPIVPRRVLGRSLFWWLEITGLMNVPACSALGRRMSSNDEVVIGASPGRVDSARVDAPTPRAATARAPPADRRPYP